MIVPDETLKISVASLAASEGLSCMLLCFSAEHMLRIDPECEMTQSLLIGETS